jgi:hypothetical protein
MTIQNGDKIEDLQSRLRDLPQDLAALFSQMLSDVPTSYKSQAACIFQILRCSDEGPRQLDGSRLLGELSLSAVRLSYAEANVGEIIGADISSMSN